MPALLYSDRYLANKKLVKRYFAVRNYNFLHSGFSFPEKTRYLPDTFLDGLGAGELFEAVAADLKGLGQVFGGEGFLDGLRGDGNRLLAQYLFVCMVWSGDD